MQNGWSCTKDSVFFINKIKTLNGIVEGAILGTTTVLYHWCLAVFYHSSSYELRLKGPEKTYKN